ncbi:MAG: Ig-like domain-containing protein, partial [Planctomycetota bacterium]|nr:Ig-like domain-containing protein [Planctomycetota bacterium]
MFRKTAHNLRSHHRRNFLRGLEPLEPRIVLAGLTIALDYSLDTNNFFADQTRKDTLQRAATVLESRINDDLGTINPTGANTWNATLTHPGTGTSHQINNPVIPVDTLVVYVGARDIGSLGIGGPGGYNASGTQSFLDSISTRGQTGIDDDTPSNTTDFAPWGGHITFDTSATWNFGNDMPVSGQNDFYSVALHEIAHVLGVGTADSWDNQVNGSGQFTGAESVAANGGNIQLNGDQSHWDNDVESTLPNSGAIQEAAMDPNLTVGTRKQFTVLDWASLEDIGWEIGDTFAPTINSVTDVTTPEDSGTQPVALSGISAGGSESQPIQVTATSANPGLIPHPTVSYNSPSSTGLLSYTSNPDQFGVATVTVTVMDGGLDGDLSTLEDNATSSTAFDVVVSEINDKPTINTLPDTVISKNAPLQQTTFTGVTAGPDESQPLLISAVSSNPNLIPNPTVDYTSPATTGTLMYQPTSDETGQTTITLTVTDGGLDGDLGTAPDNETVTISFTVTVEDSNNQPTINNITSQSIDEDSGITNVDLTGISAGDSESQPIQITAVSSNETLIATPTVTYTSPNPSGILSFSPVPDQSGTTTITVTVTDGGADGNLATPADNASVSTIFDVIVAAVNDVPTLDSVDDLALLEDDGVQTVDLTGITAGGGETQILQITASSDNPTLVADPIVDYTSANATGSLSLAPLSDQSGTATITVTLTDAGFDGNLATTEDNQSTTQIFEVVVAAVNDVPTLDSVDDLALLEDDVVQTVDLTGITAGGGETQILQVTASSDNPTLVADPIVDYTSANATGSLSLAPLSHQSGTATITVTLTDAGFDGNLATT